MIPRVQDRVTIWLDPWPHAQTEGYQLVQSLFSIAFGGFGGTGLGRGTFAFSDGRHRDDPVPQHGLHLLRARAGARAHRLSAVLLVYMLFAARGFRTALLAQDGFSKLLAHGLTFAFALQTFIIVGGVLRLIPLTGITLPFVSYGGSSLARELRAARAAAPRLQPRTGRREREPPDLAARASFALALLSALIVATTYWQAWAAPGLADRRENAIQRVAQFTIERGKIYSRDGRTLLATNRARRVDGQQLYFRRYPNGRLAAHVVGYSTQVRSRAGLEQSMNDFLTGSNANLSTVLDSRVDKLLGRHVVGNDIVTTLNLRGQRAAMRALGSNCGSVVAIEPATGRVLVMANNPTYDPNLVEGRYRQITRLAARAARRPSRRS